jgi:UDP-N-acetylmuramoyl-L-alanyl-D-glutamate--2,6-diaminopimelate ligase
MQQVGGQDAPLIVIDYAHTPDALEKPWLRCASGADRGGQLWCVFGCGGDRDPGKRPQMGKIAQRRPRAGHQRQSAQRRSARHHRQIVAGMDLANPASTCSAGRPRRRHPVGHQACGQAGRDPAGRQGHEPIRKSRARSCHSPTPTTRSWRCRHV